MDTVCKGGQGSDVNDPVRSYTGEASHGQSAYHRILDAIRTGDLAPGTRLRETDLAAQLGISRTPVREAIRLLEADGLVVHVPRAGASVRKLDYSEVMELYEMRAVLEGTAARMAARSASELEIAELEAMNADMSVAGNDEALRTLNRQFHDAMFNAAKNRFLVTTMAALSRTLIVLGPTTLAEPERATQAIEEHARLLDAIRRGDADGAEREMRAHIEAAHRMRLRQLRQRDPDRNEA